MAALHVRPARPTDLDALAELERVFPGDRLQRRQLRHLLHHANAAVWVAEEAGPAEGAGETVGDAVALFRRGSRDARLFTLAVAPEARGRGVARALLDALEGDARARGCEGVRLEVRVDNAAAIALYRARGYRETDRVDGYYEDGCSALRMRLGLEPPPNPPRPRGDG